jgi:prolyl oligopeptidase
MLRLPSHIFHVPLPHRRVFGLLTRSVSSRTMSPTPWIPDKYPTARRSDHVDIYKSAARGEVRVADPYQWMEEYSDELDKWTSEQQSFTRSYLDKNVDRQKLEDAFRASMDYAKVSGSDTPVLYHASCALPSFSSPHLP